MPTLIFLYPYLTVSSIQIIAAVAVHVSMIGLEIALTISGHWCSKWFNYSDLRIFFRVLCYIFNKHDYILLNYLLISHDL